MIIFGTAAKYFTIFDFGGPGITVPLAQIARWNDVHVRHNPDGSAAAFPFKFRNQIGSAAGRDSVIRGMVGVDILAMKLVLQVGVNELGFFLFAVPVAFRGKGRNGC